MLRILPGIIRDEKAEPPVHHQRSLLRGGQAAAGVGHETGRPPKPQSLGQAELTYRSRSRDLQDLPKLHRRQP